MNKDLKNPVHAILGNLDLLEKEVKEEMRIDLMKKAKNNGEILLNIINNILDVSTLHQG